MNTIYYTNGSDFFKLVATTEALNPILTDLRRTAIEFTTEEAFKGLKVADTLELEGATLFHYQPKKA